jgi:hypothetical protein
MDRSPISPFILEEIFNITESNIFPHQRNFAIPYDYEIQVSLCSKGIQEVLETDEKRFTHFRNRLEQKRFIRPEIPITFINKQSKKHIVSLVKNTLMGVGNFTCR